MKDAEFYANKTVMGPTGLRLSTVSNFKYVLDPVAALMMKQSSMAQMEQQNPMVMKNSIQIGQSAAIDDTVDSVEISHTVPDQTQLSQQQNQPNVASQKQTVQQPMAP